MLLIVYNTITKQDVNCFTNLVNIFAVTFSHSLGLVLQFFLTKVSVGGDVISLSGRHVALLQHLLHSSLEVLAGVFEENVLKEATSLGDGEGLGTRGGVGQSLHLLGGGDGLLLLLLQLRLKLNLLLSRRDSFNDLFCNDGGCFSFFLFSLDL